MQLLAHPFGGLPGIGALALGQHHREVGGQIAVARVARPLEHELYAVGAEARGHPRELGAQCVAHSEAAFPSLRLGAGFEGLVSALGAGLASDLSALSALGGESGLDSAAGLSASGLRGPLPSLP